jgi:hypothetical protein
MRPHLEPIARQSSSQPELGKQGQRNIQQSWYDRIPVAEQKPVYDAATDPYCPYTRSENFKKHMKKTKQLESDIKLSKSLSQSLHKVPLDDFDSSLKMMDRPISAPDKFKFPKHQVSNVSFGEAGMTYSAEPSGNAEEGLAELEVLKCILNREGYLGRLLKSARTVSRKFKPEVADILDLVRAATLDVVEAIIRWRVAKVKNLLIIHDMYLPLTFIHYLE